MASEVWAAKQFFCSVKKMFPQSRDVESIGQVKMVRPPHVGTVFWTPGWTPSVHDSLESYLKETSGMDGYDVAQMTAEFDHDRETVKVLNAEALNTFCVLKRNVEAFACFCATDEPH